MQTDEGVFLVYDALIPPDNPRDEAGYLAYWNDFAAQSVYYYNGLVLSAPDLGQALMALQRDMAIDLEPIAAASPRLERLMAEASLTPDASPTTDAASPATPATWWQPLTYAAAAATMGFDVGTVATEEGGPDPAPLPCDPPPAASVKPEQREVRPERGLARVEAVAAPVAVTLGDLVAEALAQIPCDPGDGGGSPPCTRCCNCQHGCCGSACCAPPPPCGDAVCGCNRCCQGNSCCGSTDNCCGGASDPCCGSSDPCCHPDNPCCGDPCCGDRCCQEPSCCHSPDPCCIPADSCCGNSDRCCNADNPCCGSPDPCCNAADPCCGDPDPCCNPDNPCCGNPDPCCPVTDPCDAQCGDPCICLLPCDDGDPCTIDSCASGACEHEPACPPGVPCCEGACCTAAGATAADPCCTTPSTPNCCNDACCSGPCCPGPNDTEVCCGSCDECCGTGCCKPGFCCDGVCCDDGDPCTIDECVCADSSCLTHVCDHRPACDDGNPCTTDTCTPNGCDPLCGTTCNPCALCPGGLCESQGDLCTCQQASATLTADPTAISASTQWAQTTLPWSASEITVTWNPVGCEGTLQIVELVGDSGYVPPTGQGSLERLEPTKWIYRAFLERKTELCPKPVNVKIAAKQGDGELTRVSVRVLPVHTWWVTSHKHGPGDQTHPPDTSDFANDFYYLSWKYGGVLATTGGAFASVNISTSTCVPCPWPFGCVYACTTFNPLTLTYSVVFGTNTFSGTENQAASIIGHELVHASGEVAECLPYTWEFNNAAATGIFQCDTSYLAEVVQRLNCKCNSNCP